MTRPYVVEALIREPEIPDECGDDDCSCFGSRVVRILVQQHAWMGDQCVVRSAELGACHRESGFVRVRALLHACLPLADVAESDGENFVIRAACGEVFETETELYYLTRHRAYEVDGSFSFAALKGRDGLEIADLHAYLTPLIVAELEDRILRLLHAEQLPAEAAELISSVVKDRSRERTLVCIDHFDLEDEAEEIVEKLRAPQQPNTACTDDLYRPFGR